jgi:adenylate cyclase class 2
MKTDNSQETEIKFYVKNLPVIAERLHELGAQLQQPRTHELNLRFDTPDLHLTNSYQVLRLRQDQLVHLTYKGPSDPTSEVSIRTEIEFEVSDSHKAQQFLEALGYQVTISYEKYRTTYLLENAEIVLDELPFGNFIEIEAPVLTEIKSIAEKLGLAWETRIKLSYLALFYQLKAKFKLPVNNLLFIEFIGLTYSMDEIIRDRLSG